MLVWRTRQPRRYRPSRLNPSRCCVVRRRATARARRYREDIQPERRSRPIGVRTAELATTIAYGEGGPPRETAVPQVATIGAKCQEPRLDDGSNSLDSALPPLGNNAPCENRCRQPRQQEPGAPTSTTTSSCAPAQALAPGPRSDHHPRVRQQLKPGAEPVARIARRLGLRAGIARACKAPWGSAGCYLAATRARRRNQHQPGIRDRVQPRRAGRCHLLPSVVYYGKQPKKYNYRVLRSRLARLGNPALHHRRAQRHLCVQREAERYRGHIEPVRQASPRGNSQIYGAAPNRISGARSTPASARLLAGTSVPKRGTAALRPADILEPPMRTAARAARSNR